MCSTSNLWLSVWLAPYCWASQAVAGWATGWHQGAMRNACMHKPSSTPKGGGELLRLQIGMLKLKEHVPWRQRTLATVLPLKHRRS